MIGCKGHSTFSLPIGKLKIELKSMKQLCYSYIFLQEVNLSLGLHSMDLDIGEECQCHGKGQ